MTPAHRNLQFTFYIILNIYANDLILNFRKKKKRFGKVRNFQKNQIGIFSHFYK